jgi:hypothetical protein
MSYLGSVVMRLINALLNKNLEDFSEKFARGSDSYLQGFFEKIYKFL